MQQVSLHGERNVDSRQSFVEDTAGEVLSIRPGRLTAHAVFKTSGFKIFGGRLPSKKSRTLVAAMHAIFVRVSSDAEARCGASTTFARFSPGGMTGSFS